MIKPLIVHFKYFQWPDKENILRVICSCLIPAAPSPILPMFTSQTAPSCPNSFCQRSKSEVNLGFARNKTHRRNGAESLRLACSSSNEDQVDEWWGQIHVAPHFLLRTCMRGNVDINPQIGNYEVSRSNFQVDIMSSVYCHFCLSQMLLLSFSIDGSHSPARPGIQRYQWTYLGQ